MNIEELILRYVRGEASEIEKRRLEDWRRELPANERRYQEIAEVCRLVRDLYPVPRTMPPSARSVVRRTEERARRATARAARWRMWRASGGLLAAAATVLIVMTAIARIEPSAGVQRTNTALSFETAPDESRSVTIGDGILVHMGGATRVEVLRERPYPEIFVAGRAFFGVPHQHGQRVLIRTTAGTVTVLGTRFDVRTNERDLQLLVVEGDVSLSTDRESQVVGDGELSLVNSGAIAAVVKLDDPYQYLAWMGPAMVFQSTPLNRVAQEIESRFGVDVEIAEPLLGERTVTTAFQGETLDEVIEIICSITQVACTRTGDTIRIAARGSGDVPPAESVLRPEAPPQP